MLKKRKQHEDQRSVCGRKATHSEAGKRGIIAQALGRANTTIWNVLKEKEATGVLTIRQGTVQPKKTTAGDDGTILRSVKKKPKTTVGYISINLHRAGVKVSQSTAGGDFKSRNITKCKPLISRKMRLKFTEISPGTILPGVLEPK